MKISEENKKHLIDIKEKKMQAVGEQNFEKAASFRDQEVDFIESITGINVRSKLYSIIDDEIILNEDKL